MCGHSNHCIIISTHLPRTRAEDERGDDDDVDLQMRELTMREPGGWRAESQRRSDAAAQS